MRISLNARALLVGAFAMLAAFNPLACAQTNTAAKSSTATAAKPANRPNANNAVKPSIHLGPGDSCPQFGLPPSSVTGSHHVTLTWNASVTPSTPQNTVVYCLYRRQKTPNLPIDITQCSDCELVTPKTIVGTGCVDGFVQDGQTYYYVAVAGNLDGLSKASNEANAQVLDKNVKSSPGYQSCRGDSTPLPPTPSNSTSPK